MLVILVYGEEVAALLVLKADSSLTEEQFLVWCAERMPKYSIPRSVKTLDSIPKNAMGKVNKKHLVKQYYSDSA